MANDEDWARGAGFTKIRFKSDNVGTIGESAAGRPASIYAGTSVVTPQITGSTEVESPLHEVTGLTGNTATLCAYQATVTVANGQTTGKEAAIGMSANFIPIVCLVHVTVAATNAVTLVDVGDDADTDSYVDGFTSVSINSTGFKGVFGCNGVRGAGPNGTASDGATGTADEVEMVVSGDPGATGVTIRFTFIGILAT